MSVARIGNGLYVRAGRPRPTSGIRDLFPVPHAIDKCEFDDALAAIARHLEDRR